MARPRQRARRNWPDYLTARVKSGRLYYTFKDPSTGREYGLGYDYPTAASEVRALNMQRDITRLTLAERVAGSNTKTMSAWLNEFGAILGRRTGKKRGTTERAAGTISRDKRQVEVLRSHFGEKLVADITTMDCAALIKEYVETGRERTAYLLRSFMVDCFNECEAAGWIARGTNPASVIKVSAKRTERTRLSLEQFRTLLNAAERASKPWVRLSLILAVLTGQRRGDVAAMRFEDVRDEHLHVVQIKYGQRIRIPLALGLAEIGMTLGEAIDQCRATGLPNATHLLHQIKKTASSEAGDPIGANTLTKTFAALRDRVLQPSDWDTGTPPTFHEIRALSKALHRKNGIDTMSLLGHDDAAMDALYSDPRAGWRTVELRNA